MKSLVSREDGRRLKLSGAHSCFRLRVVSAIVLSILWLGPTALAQSSRRSKAEKTKAKMSAPESDLSKFRDEYIKATRAYKSSLEKLLVIYEGRVKPAEDKLAVSQKLYADGLIAKVELEKYEQAVTLAREKVSEAQKQMASADSQIAAVFLEARADEQLAKTLKLAKGSLLRTSALIRYNGSTGWNLSDSWRIQSFFSDQFKRSLPIAVFGQGAIHDRWRLDHRNAMDISLHPDSAEGQALLSFLQRNGISFSAFREAIPGTATGPHIHIGRPSHRY